MAEAAKIAISADFLTAFAKLPRQPQGRTTEFVNRFRNNPASPEIRYEKLEGGVDDKLCGVKIDDKYLGIVAREEETSTYLLLWVDRSDAARSWAANKRCVVNPKTGVLQIYEPPARVPAKPEMQKKDLFSRAEDGDLLQMGVPEDLLPYVRSFADQEEFYASEGTLPKDAFENLSWLAEGFSVKEVLDLAREEQEEKEEEENREKSISEALETPLSMKSFVVVEGEDELRRIMAEPLEKWRVFLHPTQRRIVKKNYSGPARVLGGAGTGKTVVALHRAKYLASRLEGDEKILFTTYTVNLAADIRENLHKICNKEELRKIEVVNLDAWVAHYLREQDYRAKIEYDDKVLESVWEEALELADVDLPFETGFYQEEWNRVVLAQEALTEEKYIKASRSGRGTRLDRRKRMAVWKVFENYQNLMKEKEIRDSSWAMYECAQLLTPATRYAHVIVDEGQDFSDNAYRLIRALAGEPHPNDIFIVGDAHQRIYRNHPVLSRCGIQVRGRSSTLKINYRTTEETRKYAFALLNGISFDDLDEETDSGAECQSLTHGEAPQVRNFRDAAGEFEFLLSEIRKLNSAGTAYRDICVVARTRKLVEDYAAMFTQAGIHCFPLKSSSRDDRSADGLRLATMHRVKGLEFQYVFVAAVNDGIVPMPSAMEGTDEVSRSEGLTSERCLLYVALTRAQKAAYITSYGEKSEFLK